MRIAISGTHATGKSTLAAELARALPGHIVVDEAYHTLVEEGHVFEDMPSADDFEFLIERALVTLRHMRGGDVLFDRCPADYLAYLIAMDGDSRRWYPAVADAVTSLELVVFVPIENPDRIVSFDGSARLRRRVDRVLRDLLLGDQLGGAAQVVDVSGTPDERVEHVLEAVMARES
jgi:hypothetical protein